MQSFGNLFTWHLVLLSFLNIGMVRGYCGPSGSGMPTQTQIDACASGTSSSCAGLGCTWSDGAGGDPGGPSGSEGGGTGGGDPGGPPDMSGGGGGADQAFCGGQDGTENEACSAKNTESDCGTVSGCSWQTPPEGGDEDPCLAFTEETACTSDATTTCYWDPNHPDSKCSDTEQSGPAAVVCTSMDTYTLCSDEKACKTEGSGCDTSCAGGACALSSTCACIDKPAEVQEDTGPICMCCITKTCADTTGQGGGSFEGCASSGPFLRQDTHECSNQAPGGCTVSECCTMSQADASQGMSQGMGSSGAGGSGAGDTEHCGDKSDENTCTAVSTCSWCSDGGYCATGQCGDGGGGGGGCDMSEDQDGWDPDGNACVCKGSNNQGNQGQGAKPYCSSFTGCNALIADAATTLCNYDFCQSNQCCDMDSNGPAGASETSSGTSSDGTPPNDQQAGGSEPPANEQQAGATETVDCSTTNSAVTKSTDCIKGEYLFNGVCEKCEAGKFTDEIKSTYCKDCAIGRFAAIGSRFCTDCGQGRYRGWDDLVCKPCALNDYNDEATIETCKTCDEGQYAVKGSFQCVPCGKGRYRGTADYVCQDCPSSKYTIKSAASECISCEAGKYSPGPGSCVACGQGRYRTDSDSSCRKCPAHTYNDQDVSETCHNCPLGSRSPEGSSICQTCNAGQYRDENTNGCTMCQIGKYQNAIGGSECKPCDLGRSSLVGAPHCTECTRGQYRGSVMYTWEWTLAVLNAPVIAETEGVTVTQGTSTGTLKTTLSGGATSIIIVTASGVTFLNYEDVTIGTTALEHANIDTATTDTNVCLNCPLGKIQPLVGQEDCDDCPRGSSTSFPGGTACMTCNTGRVTKAEGEPCDDCKRGFYSDEYGKFGECSICEPGSMSLKGSANCVECLPGQFRAYIPSRDYWAYNEANAPYVSCQTCREGTFASTVGWTECQSCTPGTSSATGAITCTPCDSGRYQAGGASGGTLDSSACLACNAGKFSYKFKKWIITFGTAQQITATEDVTKVRQLDSTIVDKTTKAYAGGLLQVVDDNDFVLDDTILFVDVSTSGVTPTTCSGLTNGMYKIAALTQHDTECTTCFTRSGTSSIALQTLGGVDVVMGDVTLNNVACGAISKVTAYGTVDTQTTPNICNLNTMTSCLVVNALLGQDFVADRAISGVTEDILSTNVASVSKIQYGPTACTTCPLGYSAGTAAPRCAACDAGKYNNNVVPWNTNLLCAQCVPGTYSDQIASTTCQECAPGSSSARGAVLCTLCDRGKYKIIAGDGICDSCLSGFYAEQAGSTGCLACAAGQSSGQAQPTCTECVGGRFHLGSLPSHWVNEWTFTVSQIERTFEIGATVAQDGQVGKIKVSANGFITSIIVEADLGTIFVSTKELVIGASTDAVTVLPNKISSVRNTNKATSEDYVGECAACEAGKYSTPGTDTCPDCPNGYSSTVPAAPSCTGCDKGKYSLGAGTACTDCDVGRYQDANGQTTCKNCEAGLFTPAGLGASKCSDCGGGRYHEGWAADFLSWVECKACLPGTYSDPGMTECIICPVGTGSGAASPACESCAAGLYRPESSATWSSVLGANTQGIQCDTPAGQKDVRCPSPCGGCEPGKYSDARASVCIACPIGYQAAEQSPSCNGCTVGKFQDDTDQSECKNCEAGKFSNVTRTIQCMACHPGQSSAKAAVYCDDCKPGQYTGTSGRPTCVNCEAGMFQESRGIFKCDSCFPGFFSMQGKDICTKCAVGKHAFGQGQANDCNPCGPGTYTDEEGQSICKNCTAGTYKQSANVDGCNDCKPGSFNPLEGAAECPPCPINTRQHVEGSKKCVECKIGRFSNLGASVEACSPPVPQESPAPPVLEEIREPNVTQVNSTSFVQNKYNNVVVLTVKLNSTWRVATQNNDDSIIAVIVEWCETPDFRAIATKIQTFVLPVDPMQQTMNMKVELAQPTLTKSFYFRVKYLLQREGWVTRGSVYSPPWHTIGPTDTSCNDKQYLRIQKLDNPDLPLLPLYSKKAGVLAWSKAGSVRRCTTCPRGAFCKGHVTAPAVVPKWGYWRIPWERGKPLNETFAKCDGDDDCLGATKDQETDVVFRQLSMVAGNEDRQFRRKIRCSFKEENQEAALACCESQIEAKYGEAGTCEIQHDCVCEQSRGNGRKGNTSDLVEQCNLGREDGSIICGVCSNNYMRTRKNCVKCFDAAGRYVIVAILVILIIVGVYVASKIWKNMHQYKTAWQDVARICIINISLFQINTSLEAMIPIQWPQEWLDFKEYFEWVDIDLMSLSGTTCVAGVNFYHVFTVMGLVPYVILGSALLYFKFNKETLHSRIENMPEEKKKKLEHQALIEAFLVGDKDASGILGGKELAKVLNRELHLEEFHHGKHKISPKKAVTIIKTVLKDSHAYQLSLPQYLTAMEQGTLNNAVNRLCKLPPHHSDASSGAMLEYVMKRNLFTSSFMIASQLLLLSHSPVSKKVFLYHLCRRIGGRYFIRSDYSVECYSSGWAAFYPMVIWVLLTFTLGFPIFLTYMFYKNRKKLYSREIFGRMGFLYARYIHGSEWWEVHEMMKKVMLTGALLFFSERAMIRAVFAVMICCIVLINLNYYQPHRNMTVFWVDQIATLAATMKYLFAVVLAASGGIDNEETLTKGQKDEISTIGIVLILSDVLVLLASVVGIAECLYFAHKEHLNKNKNSNFAMSKVAPGDIDLDGDGMTDGFAIDTDGDGIVDMIYQVPEVQEHRRHSEHDHHQEGSKEHEVRMIKHQHNQSVKLQRQELLKKQKFQAMKLKKRLLKRQSINSLLPQMNMLKMEDTLRKNVLRQNDIVVPAQKRQNDMVVPVHHSEKKKRKKLKKKKTKKNRRKTEHANPQYSEDMLKMEDKLRKNLLKTPVVEKLKQMDGTKAVNNKSLENMLAASNVDTSGELHDQIMYHIDANHDGKIEVQEILNWLHRKNFSSDQSKTKIEETPEMLNKETEIRTVLRTSAFAKHLAKMPSEKQVNKKSLNKLLLAGNVQPGKLHDMIVYHMAGQLGIGASAGNIVKWLQKVAITTEASKPKEPVFNNQELLSREDELREKLKKTSITNLLMKMPVSKIVNPKSLMKLLAAGGIDTSGELLKQIMYHIDPNHDGKIEAGEILGWINHAKYASV